jgi:hypothetical protein
MSSTVPKRSSAEKCRSRVVVTGEEFTQQAIRIVSGTDGLDLNPRRGPHITNLRAFFVLRSVTHRFCVYICATVYSVQCQW